MTAILWMIMTLGQAQATVCGNGTIQMPDGRCFIPAPLHRELLPPFDVPPVETDHDEPYDINAGHAGMEQGELITCNALSTTVIQCTKRVHMRVCTDKSRFLLMSEDNRWHCLPLSQKP